MKVYGSAPPTNNEGAKITATDVNIAALKNILVINLGVLDFEYFD